MKLQTPPLTPPLARGGEWLRDLIIRENRRKMVVTKNRKEKLMINS